MFDASDCRTIVLLKFYNSNAEPPCALPNVVHEVDNGFCSIMSVVFDNV